jgi:hypothetical protein
MEVPIDGAGLRKRDYNILMQELAEEVTRCQGQMDFARYVRDTSRLDALETEYDQSLTRLRERFGEELLVDVLFNTPTIARGLPFPVVVDQSRLISHFENPSNQTFEELLRISLVFGAPELALEMIRGEARMWTTRQQRPAVERLVVYLADSFVHSPPVFPEVLRDTMVLLARADQEHMEAGGVPARLRLSDRRSCQRIRESAPFAISTLSYLLRMPWQGRGEKPVAALCSFMKGIAPTLCGEEIFRNSVDPSTSLADRRQIINYIVSSDEVGSGLPALKLLLHKSLALADRDLEFVSKHLRVVCSGILDPKMVTSLELLNRGVHQLSLLGEAHSVDGSVIVARLKQCGKDFSAIPTRFLLIAAGHTEEIRSGLESFNYVCQLIRQCDKEAQAKAWEDLRHGLVEYGNRVDFRAIKMMEVGRMETPQDALAFAEYLKASRKLASLEVRHGLELPNLTADWHQNLRNLGNAYLRLWSYAIADAFPSNAVTCSDFTREMLRQMPVYSVARHFRQQNVVRHQHLLPFFEYAYVLWEFGEVKHAAHVEKLIEQLGDPPYHRFKAHRYDEGRASVAEQLKPLTAIQRQCWRRDYFGKPVAVSSVGGTRTFRILITDFPEVLLKIGDTPDGAESCLSFSANPGFNKAVLGLIEDAHQKVALFVDVDRLPKPLQEAVTISAEMLFQYSHEIRAACVCRSVLKIGERRGGSAALVQAPEYFARNGADDSVTREFRREVDSYALTQIGLSVFAGLPHEGEAEVISIPPSSSPAGQNDDYDGVRWSSCMRGRYDIRVSQRGHAS